MSIVNNQKYYFSPSFIVEPHEIKGTAGAGDAFAAGILYCLHQGKDILFALSFANANAAINLGSATTTGAAVSYARVINYINSRKTRIFKVN